MPGTSCPSCAAELPTAPGFASWCPSCDWNLVTTGEEQSTWRLRVQRRLLDGASDRLVTELSGATRIRSRARTWSALGASLLALPVHLVTLGCFAGGLWLLITGWLPASTPELMPRIR